jgi:hypothetical protein
MSRAKEFVFVCVSAEDHAAGRVRDAGQTDETGDWAAGRNAG